MSSKKSAIAYIFIKIPSQLWVSIFLKEFVTDIQVEKSSQEYFRVWPVSIDAKLRYGGVWHLNKEGVLWGSTSWAVKYERYSSKK